MKAGHNQTLEAAASVVEAAAKVAGAEGLEGPARLQVCQERGARSEEPLSGLHWWVEH